MTKYLLLREVSLENKLVLLKINLRFERILSLL